LKKLILFLIVLFMVCPAYSATLFYLPSTGAAEVSPAFGSWTAGGTASADRIRCLTGNISSVMTSKQVSTLGGAAAEYILCRQYVSNPIAAQTISGTIKGQVCCRESNAAANATVAVSIRIVSNDGATERGTLLAISASDNTAATPPEMATSLTNRRLQNVNESASLALTNQTAQNGDRIVIELGFREVYGNTNRNIQLSLGDDSASNLPENDTDVNTYNPWIEFSQTIIFPTATIDEF
jgi:hypothetical protein